MRRDRVRAAYERAQAEAKAAGRPFIDQVLDATAAASCVSHADWYRDAENVRRIVRLGPTNPEVRARFERRADMLADATLAGAIAVVDRWHRAAIRQRDYARRTWGRPSLDALGLAVLGELRLLLRVIRRYRPEEFGQIVADIRGARVLLEAAE